MESDSLPARAESAAACLVANGECSSRVCRREGTLSLSLRGHRVLQQRQVVCSSPAVSGCRLTEVRNVQNAIQPFHVILAISVFVFPWCVLTLALVKYSESLPCVSVFYGFLSYRLNWCNGVEPIQFRNEPTQSDRELDEGIWHFVYPWRKRAIVY
jgi:hypothetical protein